MNELLGLLTLTCVVLGGCANQQKWEIVSPPVKLEVKVDQHKPLPEFSKSNDDLRMSDQLSEKVVLPDNLEKIVKMNCFTRAEANKKSKITGVVKKGKSVQVGNLKGKFWREIGINYIAESCL